MPKRKTAKQLKGQGAKSTLRKVNRFLRKHKLISKSLAIVEPMSGKYKGKVRIARKGAKALGYGKRRGQGLRLAGARY